MIFKNRIKKNKKSQLVMEGLVDVIAILFTFLTAILFFAIFKIQGCGDDENRIISNMTGNIKSNNALLSYLRKNVFIDNQQKNIADLIILYARDTKNKDYKDALMKETNSFLEFFNTCNIIKIYNASNKKKELLEIKNNACQSLYQYEFSCSSFTLPSNSDSESIIVEECLEISETKLDIGVGP